MHESGEIAAIAHEPRYRIDSIALTGRVTILHRQPAAKIHEVFSSAQLQWQICIEFLLHGKRAIGEWLQEKLRDVRPDNVARCKPSEESIRCDLAAYFGTTKVCEA